MRRDLIITLLVFYSLLYTTSCTTIITANVETSFVLSEEQQQIFAFPNRPLQDFTYLWSYRYVEITSTTSGPFEVFYGDEESSIQRAVQASDLLNNNVGSIKCQYFYESKSSLNKCSFRLSFYGESINWWMPRYETVLENNKSTYISIYRPKESSTLQFISHPRSFIVKVTEHTPWKESLAFLIGGIILFHLSGVLSKSRNLYLLMWFLLGAFLGISVIIIILLYFIARQFNSNMTLTSLTLFFTVGWSTLYFSNIVPNSFHELFRNQIWMAFMVLGGVLGLGYGYRQALTPQVTARSQFFLRIIALVIMFFSFYQAEAGVVFVILFLILRQFPLARLLGLRSLQRKLTGKTPVYSQRITEQQYQKEAGYYLHNGITDLVAAVKSQPAILMKLSEPARKKVLAMIKDEHLNVLFADIDEEPDSIMDKNEYISDDHFSSDSD